jgi:hypothetical protein
VIALGPPTGKARPVDDVGDTAFDRLEILIVFATTPR